MTGDRLSHPTGHRSPVTRKCCAGAGALPFGKVCSKGGGGSPQRPSGCLIKLLIVYIILKYYHKKLIIYIIKINNFHYINKLHCYKNIKYQSINRLSKNYTENRLFSNGGNSILALESRKSAKISPSGVPKRGGKERKTAFPGVFSQ